MTGLSPDGLLRLWEAGATQHPLDRALTILAAWEPGQTRRELAQLPGGQRDARLLAVYERAFGRRIAGQGRCPACEGRVEFNLDTRDLLAASSDGVGDAPLQVVSEGFMVQYRLPDSLDLAAIVGLSDVTEARLRLFERCIVRAIRDGAEMAVNQLSEGVLTMVAEEMAAHDPLAEVGLALTCPACGHEWQLVFDIASFLWLKIEIQARRLLREVDALARAYGWGETEILALSAVRRRAYLDMVS
jgi:hypothetical protein